MIEKATHLTLFWNLSRNPDKISSKILKKNAKFDAENEKNRKFNFQSRKNDDDFLAEILSLKNGAKECIVEISARAFQRVFTCKNWRRYSRERAPRNLGGKFNSIFTSLLTYRSLGCSVQVRCHPS